jgi:hypothetical protein
VAFIRYSISLDKHEVIRNLVDFDAPAHIFRHMKRLAAMMMFAAWLLYGAMPAMAMPGMGDMAGMPIAPQAMTEAVHDHGQHHDTKGKAETAHADQAPADHASHAHNEMSKPCPHGSGKGCVAPFCAACLVLLPDIAFADPGRFVHPTPDPQDAPSLVISAARPPIPPPRA